MATKAILTALTLCLCIQFIFSAHMIWLTPEESAALSHMCPENETKYREVPMPPEHCDIDWYLGCQGGRANQKIQCPEGKIYNRNASKPWCESNVNATRPPGCPPASATKSYPRTCREVTLKPDTVPMEYTCNKYIMCDNSGDFIMDCQQDFYYYGPLKRCIYREWPYSTEMPDDFIKECREKDK